MELPADNVNHDKCARSRVKTKRYPGPSKRDDARKITAAGDEVPIITSV